VVVRPSEDDHEQDDQENQTEQTDSDVHVSSFVHPWVTRAGMGPKPQVASHGRTPSSLAADT
jgi:hypothetical protein